MTALTAVDTPHRKDSELLKDLLRTVVDRESDHGVPDEKRVHEWWRRETEPPWDPAVPVLPEVLAT